MSDKPYYGYQPYDKQTFLKAYNSPLWVKKRKGDGTYFPPDVQTLQDNQSVTLIIYKEIDKGSMIEIDLWSPHNIQYDFLEYYYDQIYDKEHYTRVRKDICRVNYKDKIIINEIPKDIIYFNTSTKEEWRSIVDQLF